MYAYVSQAVYLFEVSPPKLCMHLSSLPYMLHAPPISFFIWSPEYLASNTDHEAPHYVVFSTPYLVPLRPKYPPQHPILKHPQPMFVPQCEGPSLTTIQHKSPVHFHIYIFGQQTGRQNIQQRLLVILNNIFHYVSMVGRGYSNHGAGVITLTL